MSCNYWRRPIRLGRVSTLRENYPDVDRGSTGTVPLLPFFFYAKLGGKRLEEELY